MLARIALATEACQAAPAAEVAVPGEAGLAVQANARPAAAELSVWEPREVAEAPGLAAVAAGDRDNEAETVVKWPGLNSVCQKSF